MSEKMTASQAKTFEHGKSTTSEMILLDAAQARGCNCQPYEDWFTYKRWQAQGFQVQKGEKGTRLSVFVTKEKKDGTKVTFPKRTSVFCRCQVEPKDPPKPLHNYDNCTCGMCQEEK